MRLIQFLKTHSFIDTVFPWIRQCVDRAMIPLSIQQIKALLHALRDISAMPNSQGIDAAHLHDLVTGLVAQKPL